MHKKCWLHAPLALFADLIFQEHGNKTYDYNILD